MCVNVVNYMHAARVYMYMYVCMVHALYIYGTCTRVVYMRVCASYMTRYFFTNSSYICVGQEGAA